VAERVAEYCQSCGAEVILAAHARTGMAYALDVEPVPAHIGTHELLNKPEMGHQRVGGMWRCRPLSTALRATRKLLYVPHSETCTKKGRR